MPAAEDHGDRGLDLLRRRGPRRVALRHAARGGARAKAPAGGGAQHQFPRHRRRRSAAARASSRSAPRGHCASPQSRTRLSHFPTEEDRMKARLAIAACAAAALTSGSLYAQSTLDAVKSKGYVQCGVNTGLAGFSQPDSKGVWRGIDVDVCRAVAAAVL